MSGKSSLMEHKKSSSFTALWHTIEAIYGEIPEIIKTILQLNGFDSFLALKGIRYDDKNEFFCSLESTINEILSSQDVTEEKRVLDGLLPSNYKHFRLKPGHKNLIMNLMLEIDKVDVEEFFNKAHAVIEESSDENSIPQLTEMAPIKSSPKHDNQMVVYEASDHVYTHDELCNQKKIEEHDEEEEFILEEYIDDKSSPFEQSYIYNVSNDDSHSLNPSPRKKKPAQKRRPDRMYNEEFLSQCINPRKRRVTTVKTYSDNDEGIRERFSDLIQQSMQCILSASQLDEVEYASIVVTKETDTSYNVVCPLCNTKIKLAVVFENNGRYRNYKRSNFERHLRFKHCKEDKSSSEVFHSTYKKINF